MLTRDNILVFLPKDSLFDLSGECLRFSWCMRISSLVHPIMSKIISMHPLPYSVFDLSGDTGDFPWCMRILSSVHPIMSKIKIVHPFPYSVFELSGYAGYCPWCMRISSSVQRIISTFKIIHPLPLSQFSPYTRPYEKILLRGLLAITCIKSQSNKIKKQYVAMIALNKNEKKS